MHQPRHLRALPDLPPDPQRFPYPTPLGMEPDPPAPAATDPAATDPAATDLAVVPEHRVRIRLVYRDRVTWMATTDRSQTPWKWRADCTCGWGCMSWSWSREYGVLQSGLTREQWIAENGEPTGGALPWALEHLAEKSAPARQVQEA